MTPTPYIRKLTPEYIKNREEAKTLFKQIAIKILDYKIDNKKVVSQIDLC